MVEYTVRKLNQRKLSKKRLSHHFKKIDPGSDDDEDGHEVFIANPSDDLPRNKLVEKHARGL